MTVRCMHGPNPNHRATLSKHAIPGTTRLLQDSLRHRPQRIGYKNQRHIIEHGRFISIEPYGSIQADDLVTKPMRNSLFKKTARVDGAVCA